ncbi:MAG TPA: phosphatase PAP2 family protein, partial [Thermoanaerobaculia bacterium]|nr:phosphatase PAP2 family protein [Thermoanaerobaculia bacterium]
MTQRRLLLWGAALTALTLLAVFLLDPPIAAAMSPRDAHRFADPFINAIELVFLFALSKWASGLAILVVALILLAFRRHRALARLLLFVAATELLTRLVAGVLKNVFLRARPLDAQAGHFFVDGGSSFPSGHAAHFWGLFFALAVAFPRVRIPALIVALLVCIARVAVNDHYLGDVLGSAAIAAFVCSACAAIIRPVSPRPSGTPASRRLARRRPAAGWSAE